MYRKTFNILIILSLILVIFACGAEVPKKELTTAKKEILRAEVAQANNFDKENLEEARTELTAAEALVKKEKNEEAKKKALNSIVKARTAVKNSKIKLLSNKIEKIGELIKEAKRFHAQKIASENFKKGVAKYKEAKKLQTSANNKASTLNDQIFRTGDTVAKYEDFIKEADKAIKAATEASTLIENALVAAKERIQKLERNIANATTILNQLQNDSLIVKNFKDKLEAIRNNLNQANEYYKKFKFTENAEEALNHLRKAEELALKASNQADQLNTEGRAQLQALYRERAQRSLTEARERVNEAERVYQNRQAPGGSRRNPWIPRRYRTTNSRAQVRISQNTSESGAESQPNNDPAQVGESSSGDNSTAQPQQSNETQTQPDSTDPAQVGESNQQSAPQGDSSQSSTGQQNNQTPSSDSAIENELERQGTQEQQLTIEQVYQKMKAKIKSAEEKYARGDYVGAWEDSEEAKRLAAKIKEMSGAAGASTADASSYKKLKIWKYYTVKYRRRNTDCLWRIALKMYGDATLWPMIWYANKLKIADPDIIMPGQKLAIPVQKNARRN